MYHLIFLLTLSSLVPTIIGAGQRWSLRGKNIVVTGGSKGIGLACVDEICAMGATVLTCSRNSTELELCQTHWQARGYKVHTLAADMSSEEGRQSLIDEVDRRFGGSVDALVNNVGSNIRKRAIEYSDSEYDHIMRTNLKSAFALTTKFYPFLKRARNGGSVVNIGSVAGGCATAMRSGVVYAMTKAAMTQMTNNLACEWAQDKIRVNVLAPWYIDTPLVQPVLKDPALLKTVLARTPMGRVGTPQEVSAVVAFLCLDAASYVTGQCIAIDGGFLRNGFY